MTLEMIIVWRKSKIFSLISHRLVIVIYCICYHEQCDHSAKFQRMNFFLKIKNKHTHTHARARAYGYIHCIILNKYVKYE